MLKRKNPNIEPSVSTSKHFQKVFSGKNPTEKKNLLHSVSHKLSDYQIEKAKGALPGRMTA